METVYDLATSTLFGNAANIYRAAIDAAGPNAPETLYGKLNQVPYHLLVRSRLRAAERAVLKAPDAIACAGTLLFRINLLQRLPSKSGTCQAAHSKVQGQSLNIAG